MPYRHAWLYLAALLALTIFAFWPSYISGVRSASFETHAHTIPSLLWMVLMIIQSWSIHAARRDFHRTLGLASLLLFPLFLAGGLLISVGMAKRLLAGDSTFHELFAARLAPVDALGMAGIGWCFHQALRHRRHVQLHARYMLATLVFLLGPIALRIFPPHLPSALGGTVTGLSIIAPTLQLTALTTLVGLAFLVLRAPRYGRPWIEAGGFIVMQIVLFETIGLSESWQRHYPLLAQVPAFLLAAIGLTAGAAIAWSGWAKALPRAPSDAQQGVPADRPRPAGSAGG